MATRIVCDICGAGVTPVYQRRVALDGRALLVTIRVESDLDPKKLVVVDLCDRHARQAAQEFEDART